MNNNNNNNNNGAYTWHAVYEGVRQIIVYSPQDTHAIGGDVIMEGTTAYDPFKNATTLAEANNNSNTAARKTNSNGNNNNNNVAARAARARVAVMQSGEVILIPHGWWWTVRAITKGLASTGTVHVSNTSTATITQKAKQEAAMMATKYPAPSSDVSILSDRNLSISERATAAKRIGNEQFTRGRYSLAVEAYTRAVTLLSGVDGDSSQQQGTSTLGTTGSMSEEDESLLATVLCNRAAVNLKLKLWTGILYLYIYISYVMFLTFSFFFTSSFIYPINRSSVD